MAEDSALLLPEHVLLKLLTSSLEALILMTEGDGVDLAVPLNLDDGDVILSLHLNYYCSNETLQILQNLSYFNYYNFYDILSLVYERICF